MFERIEIETKTIREIHQLDGSGDGDEGSSSGSFPASGPAHPPNSTRARPQPQLPQDGSATRNSSTKSQGGAGQNVAPGAVITSTAPVVRALSPAFIVVFAAVIKLRVPRSIR